MPSIGNVPIVMDLLSILWLIMYGYVKGSSNSARWKDTFNAFSIRRYLLCIDLVRVLGYRVHPIIILWVRRGRSAIYGGSLARDKAEDWTESWETGGDDNDVRFNAKRGLQISMW